MCKARTQCYAPGAIGAMEERHFSKLPSDKEILGKFTFMNLYSARRKTRENISKYVSKSCSKYLIPTKIIYVELANYVHSFKDRQEHERVCDVFLSWVDEH